MSHNVYLYILVMAIVTYLIRMLPLALAKNEIRSPFIKSFLYYVPYACLAAMTFPAILKATDSIISGAAGFLVALIAAYKEKSLITVALLACAAVFIVERVLVFIEEGICGNIIRRREFRKAPSIFIYSPKNPRSISPSNTVVAGPVIYTRFHLFPRRCLSLRQEAVQ